MDKNKETVVFDDSNFYEHKDSIKQDCSICENKGTKWCGGCDYNLRHPNNFDFYRPIRTVTNN